MAASWAVPSFIAETARLMDAGQWATPTAQAAGRRALVLIQLGGGNDGLNTLIPYGDPVYYSPTVRPALAIPQSSVIPIDNYVGLHPSLLRLNGRWRRGQVAAVQGVSYPNPNRSHFRGTDIWESAVPDRLEAKGWMGRYLEVCSCQRSDHLEAMAVGMSGVPGTFWTDMALVPAVASISSFRYTSVNNGNASQRNAEIQTLRNGLAQADGRPEAEFLRQSILTALTDADILAAAAASYNPIGAYPNNGFGNAMRLTAQLIAADVGTQVFYVSLGGFDTHAAQLAAHASLLSTLDQSVDAFMQDMESTNRLGDVTLMTFSEFGRRLAGNGSAGSDHGVAAPMFVMGGSVRGGLHGTYPSLTDLTSGDLKMQVDFRSVYATMLRSWLNVDPGPVLGGSFPTLNLFQASCAQRPPVNVSVTPTGPDRMQVLVTAGTTGDFPNNWLRALSFASTNNGLVDIGSQTGATGQFTETLANGTKQTSFTVRRASSGATTVSFDVTDDCARWPTFVGGGAAPWGPESVTVSNPSPGAPAPSINTSVGSPSTPSSLPAAALSPPSKKKKKKRRKRR